MTKRIRRIVDPTAAIRFALGLWICVAWAIAAGADEINSIQRSDDTLPAGITKQRVTFKSHDLTLVGLLFAPDGPGPFPAILWNHGSEKNPGSGPQFDTVARYFVPEGYVVFAPIRRGHGYSQGEYIGATLEQIRRVQGRGAAENAMVRLMASEQLEDELAGLSYMMTLKVVDSSRMIVAGCSYGGIETLLAAEGNSSFKGAIAISPAALSWQENPPLQKRLLQGVARINVPVLLIQPAKDASLEPSRVLGAEFKRLQKDFTGKVFPAIGPPEEQLHCFGGAKGTHVWAPDALAFIARVLR
jgi:carboxymethylenebutenolidase